MKNHVLLFLCCIASLTAVSQQGYFYVTGKVISAETKLPMQGASVFAQNTTFGTTTDQDGNFALQLPNGGYDIVITFTGFNAESRRIGTMDHNKLQFELGKKERLMESVSIVSTGEVKDGWEKYGNFFQDQFLGKTINSSACTIKNKDALKFFFSKRKNRLKVLASSPLVIDNNALGYTIKYELDSFVHEYNSEVSLYTGYPLFEEKLASSPEEQGQWNEARQKAYKGSILHFMRSIYHKQLQDEGMEIQFCLKLNEMYSAIRLKNFYAALQYQKDDSTQVVQIMPNQREVGVIYTHEKPAEGFLIENPGEPKDFQFSILKFAPQKSVTIEQNGYFFEQNDITMNAYWTWDKMADALPYDFNYMADNKKQADQ